MEIKRYAFQDLTIKQVEQFAQQYAGIDMWQYLCIDENRFPLVISDKASWPAVYFWSKRCGLVKGKFDDPVLEYAVGRWLLENAHPNFTSEEAALQYASQRQWPRLHLDT